MTAIEKALREIIAAQDMAIDLLERQIKNLEAIVANQEGIIEATNKILSVNSTKKTYEHTTNG